MRMRTFIAGIVAATLAGGAALAQSAPDREEPAAPEAAPEPLPPVEADPAGPRPDPVSEEAARKLHLDELFVRLADPESEDWERTQGQIWRVWNQSGSDSMDLLASRADAAVEKKDFDTALLHLNDLVRLAPDFAEAWNKRATVHFLRDDYGASLEDIAKTLALEPRHFGALSGLGIILDRIGDQEGALEAYRRAVAIHPHLPGAQEGIKKLEREVEGQRL